MTFEEFENAQLIM